LKFLLERATPVAQLAKATTSIARVSARTLATSFCLAPNRGPYAKLMTIASPVV
jgi:hypothetical protein